MAIVNRFCDVTSPYAFRTHYFYTVHMLTTIADIGNKSVPIQLAQCRFPRLAISNAKIYTMGQNRLLRLSTYGRRAFSVAGPMAWNSLPGFIRAPTSSTDCFRRLLRTHLFSRY